MYRYTTHRIYDLRPGTGYPAPDVLARLKSCGVFRNRGCRGGRRVTKTIPIIQCKRIVPKPKSNKQYKHFEIPRLWYNLPSVLLSNVTSLNNKLDEVITTVKSVNPDIVAITEAWQVVPETCVIENYEVFHQLRTNRRGGGLVMFSRGYLNPCRLSVEVPGEVEALWVKITPPRHPRHTASVVLCLAYHPPRSPTGPLLVDHIISTADTLRTRLPSSRLVVCGDFNELDVGDILDHLSLRQVVDFPTHGRNTLDLVMTDMADLYLPPQPLPPMGRSPHLSVLWSPTLTTSLPPVCTVATYRPLTDSALRRFGQWVVAYPWTEVIATEDVNTKWENYHSSVMKAYHHFFPPKTSTKHPSDLPWITPRIKRLLEYRNQAFYTNTYRYRQLRNQVIREIHAVKKTHYPTKVHHLLQSNTSQWYTRIRDLCGLGKVSRPFHFLTGVSGEEAAQLINTHFSTICQSLPQLDLSLLPVYLPSPSPPPTVEVFQVAGKLLSLKQKRSTTPIDLPLKIYKEFAPELAVPITSIINASLRQSKCPADWKTSYVTPIPKLPNPPSFNDLRPIAITPIPSLICEDFIFNWAYDTISSRIDLQQFGNVKSSSTTHCLVSLLDFIYQNLDKRKTSLALTFIDFRKAFDLVDHTTVIRKALHLGLPGYLVSWLSDFLSGRRQVTRYQGHTSTFHHLTCGVPQGTKMGPLCFLLLINDALTDTPHRWKYVDDSTVGVTINNSSPDYSHLQNILDNLQVWTTENHITINQSKTVVMHFNTSKTPVPPPVVTVGSHSLQVVESTKLLGVTVDSKLDWKLHTTNTVKTSTYKLHMLKTMKSLGAQHQQLRDIYGTFILPKLTYASPAWSPSLNITQQRRLERVQKRACKIILGPAYTSYHQALTALNLTSLAERYHRDLQVFGERLLTHPRHRLLLPPALPPPLRAARHHNILKPIRARTDRYKNSPIPTIVNIINNK